ncbi:hypothetical protein B0H13DRAFT_2373787 [Mycena leptocephala]|nr:hypothetical protein B0H13DRAFT_2373787 [Mycena leptocephala]
MEDIVLPDEGNEGGEGGEQGDEGVEPSAGGDADGNTTQGSIPNGRPTQKQRDAFERAFADVRDRLAQCASEAHVSYGGVLKAFYQEEHAGLRAGKNTWNLYQRFANYDDQNRLRERRRLDPSYPSATPVPALKADELSGAYKVFLAFAGGEEKAEAVLDTFFQLDGTADDTIQARRRRFQSAVKTFKNLNDRFRLDDFFALTIIVGAHTNEDQKLGSVVTIPGMDEALYTGLATNENEMVGILKTAAATIVILEQAKMRRDQKESSSSVAGPTRLGVPSAIPSAPATPSNTARRTRRQPVAPASPGPNERSPSPNARTAPLDAPPDVADAAPPNAASTAAARLPAVTPMLRRNASTKNSTIFSCEIRGDTKDLNELRDVMELASVEDVGEEGFRMLNYPANVRLPSEAPSTKGSGSWTRPERRWLRVSIAARTTPGQGLRFERLSHPEGESNFVVLSHDYSLVPPSGAPDSPTVKAFWRSSTVPVHCTAGDNTTWEATYNLDNPATLARPRSPKLKSRWKRKVDEADELDELEQEEETSPPTKRLRHRTPEPRSAVVLNQAPPSRGGPDGQAVAQGIYQDPPRVGTATPRVHFTSPSQASLEPDSDDQPIQAPARQRRSIPVPLYDSDDSAAPAPSKPARANPKPALRKRPLPDDEYSEGSDADPAEVSAAPSKPAPSNAKPVVKVFDGVEVASPTRKKVRTAPAAEGSSSRKAPIPGVPVPRPRPRRPRRFAPPGFAPAGFAFAAPGAAAVPNLLAGFPAPGAGALPNPLAGLTQAQMQTLFYAAFFGGAAPPPAPST